MLSCKPVTWLSFWDDFWMTLPAVCSYTHIHAFMHLNDGNPEGNEDLIWEVILRNFWTRGLQLCVGPDCLGSSTNRRPLALLATFIKPLTDRLLNRYIFYRHVQCWWYWCSQIWHAGRTELIKWTDAIQMVKDCSKLCSGTFQQVHDEGNEHFYWTTSSSVFNVNCYYSAMLMLLHHLSVCLLGLDLFRSNSAAKISVAALCSSFTQINEKMQEGEKVSMTVLSNEGRSPSFLSLQILVLIVLKFS